MRTRSDVCLLGELEHRVAPGPEVTALGAAAERPLEGVAVRVDEAGDREPVRHVATLSADSYPGAPGLLPDAIVSRKSARVCHERRANEEQSILSALSLTMMSAPAVSCSAGARSERAHGPAAAPDPRLRRVAHSGRRGVQLAGRDRLRRRGDHRPGRRLARPALARRVGVRQGRRPARRPADDRRGGDHPGRSSTTASRGSPSC